MTARAAAVVLTSAMLAAAGCGGEETDAERAAEAAESTAARIGTETLRRDDVEVSDATCTKAPDDGPAFWACRVPVEDLVVQCSIRVQGESAGSNCHLRD